MSNIFTQGYACIIGVGADLPNTVDDATVLANILKDPARCAYAPKQVHLLTSEQATRSGVLSTLDTLASSTDAQSTVIIYFSGHGCRVTGSIGDSYYLMPFGYNLNQLDQTAINASDFTARLRAIPAQKLLVLLDCCHAGGIGHTKVPGLQLTKSPLPPEAQQMLSLGSGLVIIASSQENEFSWTGTPYSTFTTAVVETLCGKGVSQQDGYVRVADLALYAREVVPKRTNNRQHPLLHFEQADNFVLAYYAGGDTQPKELPFGGTEIESEPGELNRQIDSGNYVGRDRIGGDQAGGDKITVGDISGSTGIAIGRYASARANTINQLQDIYNPEAHKLVDLLKQLQLAVQGVDAELSQKNQEKALKHLDVLGKFGQDRQNPDLREQAETALDALPTILRQGSGLNKAQTEIFLDTIREILRL